MDTASSSNVGSSVPRWSIMIPTYNPDPRLLQRTLESLFIQSADLDSAQIEIVDDASTGTFDPETLLGDYVHRVQVRRESRNVGLSRNWNRCIEYARGDLVHLLHQDDYVLPGFYRRIAEIAAARPGMGLMACRSFFIDDSGVIEGVTPRLRGLESGGNAVEDFYYTTPIQCPGVVVRRSAYLALGGFREDLPYTLDREMWARVVAATGGFVTHEILACYRMSSANETARLFRTGEAIRDLERISRLFSGRYSDFSQRRAMKVICDLAYKKYDEYRERGDHEAARINLALWRERTPYLHRLAKMVRRQGRGLLER